HARLGWSRKSLARAKRIISSCPDSSLIGYMFVNAVRKQIVLAYSGGRDTSVIMRWLIETYHCPVVAFVANVGQQEDLEAIAQKAQQTGASQVCVEDVRETFVRDFVFPALRAHAVYEGTYLLGTSLARPLIAKTQVDIARRVGADAVWHRRTGKGHHQVHLDGTDHAV